MNKSFLDDFTNKGGQSTEIADSLVENYKQEGYLNKVIGARTYSIKPMPTSEAIQFSTKILKLVGPSIGAVGDGIRNDDIFGGDSFENAAKLLFDNLGDNDILIYILMLLQADTIKVNGVDSEFETAFAGKLGDVLELVLFALEENFDQVKQLASSKMNLGSLLSSVRKGMKEAEDGSQPPSG